MATEVTLFLTCDIPSVRASGLTPVSLNPTLTSTACGATGYGALGTLAFREEGAAQDSSAAYVVVVRLWWTNLDDE